MLQVGEGVFFLGHDNMLAIICQNNIHDNVSDSDGGGISLYNVNYTVFENNVVHHNQAANGAGCSMQFGSPMIVNNKFCNNEVPINGGFGCLYIENCNAKLVSNLISNNTAVGIVCVNSSSTILNNTITFNNYNDMAGIVFDENSDANIKNCIIYGNIADNPIYGHQVTIWDDNSDPHFDHCDIEGGLEGFGGPGSGVNYNSANYTNNISTEPLFVNPSAGAGSGYNGLEADWQLQMQSPCINAGDTTGVSQYLPPFDLGGNPRITNEIIDIGAYESCTPLQPSEIAGNANHPCQSSTQEYSVINVTGISYFWEFPAGWEINSGQGSNAVNVTVGATSGNITVTPSNSCGNGMAGSLGVTVNLLPAQPSVITGNSAPCQATVQDYSVTTVPGISYFWEVPAGWEINSGQGSNAVNVTVGAASGNIMVTPSNDCGNGPVSTLAASAVSLPSQPLQPSGPVEVDLHFVSVSQYLVEPVANASNYTWELLPAAIGNLSGAANEVTVTWSGLLGEATLKVKSENECGESQWSAPLTILVENSVGVSEQAISVILIFPNPAKEILNISGITTGTKIQASMISSDGKTLFTSILNADGQIDVSGLSTGIYFLKLEDGDSVRYEKVVVE